MRHRSKLFALLGVGFVATGLFVAIQTFFLQRTMQDASDTMRDASNTANAVVVEESAIELVDLSITTIRANMVAEAMPSFDPMTEVEVPFTRFETANHTGRFLIVPALAKSVLEIGGIGRISFDRNGVPLKMVEIGNGQIAIFFRESFSGHLYLYKLRADGIVSQSARIRGFSDAEPILRNAIFHRERLIAILYDNERGLNEVVLLDQEETTGELQPKLIAALPTLEDPAGGNYEMMPTLFLLPAGEELWIVGGTLVARLGVEGLAEQHRLAPCERTQEAVAGGDGPIVLCLLDSGGEYQFALSHWSLGGQRGEYSMLSEGKVPFDLSAANNLVEFNFLETTDDVSRLLRYDLTNNQVSGVMELGSNNIEGRIAWSQIYFLNGLLDIIRMAATDNQAFERLYPLVRDAKLRLDIEMQLLDKLMETPLGYLTEAFTKGREPALFAVQTGRLLLLFNRYADEISNGVSLTSHEALRESVLSLNGHIDQLRVAREGDIGVAHGRHFLAWPKGSTFPFDGLNVPFNHQNEWAYAVLDTYEKGEWSVLADEAASISVEIINHFLEAVAPDARFPHDGEWPYWWGQAWEGWTVEEDVSVNTPAYVGDKSVAFISFRSIDLMSTMAAHRLSFLASEQTLRESMERAVARGHVYPFVAASFVEDGYRPALDIGVALHYARQTAPWELQSAVWAALDVPVSPTPEDPHSYILNAKVLLEHPEISRVRPDGLDGAQALLDYLNIAVPYNAELAMRYAGLELGGKVLAWNLAYDLDAAAAALERTQDLRFARVLEEGLDTAMQMRDDRLGLRDEIRDVHMPAWGTNRYSPEKDKWMAWDTFTGIISHAAIVYADLAQKFGDDAMKRKGLIYLRDSIDALDAFDPWWREDLESGIGWYFDPLYLDVAPLNHMNLLGLAHVELCSRFNREASCRKSEGLAKYFERSLKHHTDGSCSWEYWAGAQREQHSSESAEDVTHAHINVRFAHLAWENGIVFDRSDIECIGRSLTVRIMRPSGDWAMNVDGTGNMVESRLHEGISAWMILEEVVPGVQERIDEFMMAREDAYPLGLLSYATGPASFARRLPLKE